MLRIEEEVYLVPQGWPWPTDHLTQVILKGVTKLFPLRFNVSVYLGTSFNGIQNLGPYCFCFLRMRVHWLIDSRPSLPPVFRICKYFTYRVSKSGFADSKAWNMDPDPRDHLITDQNPDPTWVKWVFLWPFENFVCGIGSKSLKLMKFSFNLC